MYPEGQTDSAPVGNFAADPRPSVSDICIPTQMKFRNGGNILENAILQKKGKLRCR